MGTVTSLRRVMGYAGAGLGVLAGLAWTLVTAKMIVLSAGGLLVAAVMSVAGAASGGAESAWQAEGGRPPAHAGPDHGRDHRESP